MAGDWIKIEKSTLDKPEVLAIAGRLKISADLAFARLVRVWAWADSNIVNGFARGVTLEMVDSISALPGLASAMVEVDWLSSRNDGIFFPRFARHIGKSAKSRALTNKRVKRLRSNKSVTREEKRRDTATQYPPGSPPAKPREPNPVWDTLAELFYPDGVPKSQCARLGKIASDLTTLKATPASIRTRYERAREAWAGHTFGPEAIVKHWGALGLDQTETGNTTGPGSEAWKKNVEYLTGLVKK